MPAFSRAIELGVDALEMDAHLSVDGEVFISHDSSGSRMCGVDAEIKSSVATNIRSWDAGSQFHDSSGNRSFAGIGIKLPTLDEVLAEFPDVIINLDLKQESPSMVDATVSVINKHRAANRVVLASFSLRTLLAVRRSGYQGATGLCRAELLTFVSTPRWLYRRLPLRGEAAQLPHQMGPIDVGNHYVIDKCHAVGIRADFWTVNDPQRAIELLNLGADGIMTDDPAALVEPFQRWRESS